MEVYDLAMLLVLAGLTIFGAWKGLAWQVAYLASLFFSFVVAVQLRGPLAAMISAEPPWNTFFAMLILYLGSSLAIWVGFRFVREAIEKVKLKEFDHQAGAVLGLGRGVLWCVLITLFAVTLANENQQQAILQSRSGRTIAELLHSAKGIMPAELDQVLGPYLKPLQAAPGSGADSLPDHWNLAGAAGEFLPASAAENRPPPASIFGGADDDSPGRWRQYLDDAGE